jgi:hypothetical protein
LAPLLKIRSLALILSSDVTHTDLALNTVRIRCCKPANTKSSIGLIVMFKPALAASDVLGDTNSGLHAQTKNGGTPTRANRRLQAGGKPPNDYLISE